MQGLWVFKVVMSKYLSLKNGQKAQFCGFTTYVMEF